MTTTPARGRATLAQVAAEAGVSLATASKVINDRADVAAATREKVRAAIGALGYSPTTAIRSAGALQVEVVFDAMDSMYSMQVLAGLLTASEQLGVDIVVKVMPELTGPPGEAGLDGWANSLIGTGRRGAIFVTCELRPEQVAAFRRLDIPVVAVDSYTLLSAGIVSIGSSNFAGGLSATEHLIELGHTRIGMIGGPARSVFVQERAHGFRAALESAGLTPDPALMRHGAFSYESGLAFGAELLALPEPPTAIVAACDPCAIGVMEAARQRGMRVPEDLSVVGFDDTHLAIWTTPQLTTVRQPLAEMGAVALRTVLRMADGQPADSPHVQLATTLVPRDSTARLRP